MKLVILLLLVGLMAPSLAAEGPYELFESPLYSAEISFPAFSVYPKFSDGSTYREQHVEFVLESIQEGVYNASQIPSVFEVVQETNYTTLSQELSYSRWEDQVVLSNGTVLANRKILHVERILPSGANVSMNFEVFDSAGFMMWGPRPVNISAGSFKYSVFVSGWNFADPSNRLRMLVSVRYVTGDFDAQLPVPTLVDWFGPGRKVIATWPTTGPLTVTLDCDGWSLADGIPGSMPVNPNPFFDAGYMVINNQVAPKYISATFGWVAPPFEREVAWDPTLYLSLFSNIAPTQPKDNFSRNAGIIAGSVVGGAVFVTAAIATIWYRHFLNGRAAPRPSKFSTTG